MRLLITMFVVLVGATGRAQANLVYTLATDSKGDSATAEFKFVTGGIEVVVTNTGSATNTDSANAISQVQFTINTATVGLPTVLTELSGDQITYLGKGSGTDQGFQDFKLPSSDPNLHWSFSTSGTSAVNLVDVSGGGLTGPAGHAAEMIVPLNATTKSNSLSNFNPSFNGTANFFLAVAKLPPTLTTSDITGVKFSFGSGCEDLLQAGTGSGTTQPPVSVPEPSTLAIAGLGALGFFGYGLRRRCAR